MKITEFGTVQSTNVRKKGDIGKASGSFADMLALSDTHETAPSSGLNDIHAMTALSTMLAMQEISEEDIHRKKLAQQGKNLLDTLEKLRQQLLVGTLPMQLLQDMERQLSIKKRFISDPHLMAVVEDIELRAAVELAKLEKALQDQNYS